MRLHTLLLAAVAGLAIASTPRAATVLYFQDGHTASDPMAAALAASSHTVTQVSWYGDFREQIALGGWDLVVYFQKHYTSQTGAAAATAQWVQNGGRAIYADWSLDNGIAAAFDAAFTLRTNQAQVHFDDSTIGDVVLTNPGWDSFSQCLQALTGASAIASFANGDAAAVLGNDGRTILNGFLNDTLDMETGIALFSRQVDRVLSAEVPEIHHVPEPASWALFSLGFSALVATRQRRRPGVSGCAISA